MRLKQNKLPKTKTSKTKKTKGILQSQINIGLIGHVDHGKTSLCQKLSGKWTDTHSEEIKRGITIKLGYADTIFYKCPKCKSPDCYKTSAICPDCKEKCEPLIKVSFIDAPGHESLMATMLSGAAIMDAALLVIAANEPCPQPQTKEHLIALDIIGVKNIIIVQNKIDLVSKEEALKNYKEIKDFVKNTIAKDAPIIPISAQHNINIGVLVKTIYENFKIPEHDIEKDPIFFIARSFDVNKPGSEVKNIVGGILGGALKHGKLKVKDKIEIRPGFKIEKEGKVSYLPIFTEIVSIKTGNENLEEAYPGGSIGLLTKLDPSIVKADSLTGNIAGYVDKLPKVWHEFTLKPVLFERIVGAKDELVVAPIKKTELLMLNINSSATIGAVLELKKDLIKVKLRIPVCAEKNSRVTISRILNNRWRLIGYSGIVE